MKEFYSKIANCRIRYHDFAGNGVPCIFIHGLGCASSYEYPDVIIHQNFTPRAILIDRVGSGFSERPLNFSYTTTMHAKVIIELIEHLSLDEFWLYGHSMGGSIAIEVATMKPDNLLGLIVSEPNFHAGGGFFSRKIIEHDEKIFISAVYSKMLEEEKSLWAGSLLSNAPWALWRSAKSLVDGVTPSWMSQFMSVEAPKLLIFGEHSLPDDDFSNLSAQGVETMIVNNAGHSMSWENPASLADCISRFIKSKTK